jgi:hypothetical protein
MNETPNKGFEAWCIVELLGHVRLAGKVTEEEHFGTKLGRVDIPTAEGGFITQFFSGNSIYRITPTTEEIARGVIQESARPPLHNLQLPANNLVDDDDDDEFDGDKRYRDCADDEY